MLNIQMEGSGKKFTTLTKFLIGQMFWENNLSELKKKKDCTVREEQLHSLEALLISCKVNF